MWFSLFTSTLLLITPIFFGEKDVLAVAWWKQWTIDFLCKALVSSDSLRLIVCVDRELRNGRHAPAVFPHPLDEAHPLAN